ncbi:MAG: hypothetical protein ACK5NL_12720 [Vibrio fluvialis]
MSTIEEIERKFQEITAEHGAGLDFEKELICFAYRVEESHPVVHRFSESCKKAAVNTEFVDTFGGSDNNNFMQHGIIGIVISCGMNQVHSCNEFSSIYDLEKCSEIVYHLLTMN